MKNINTETVIEVNHWNDTLFSFKTTRDKGFRFENGQFVMMGIEVNDKPLMRAYSIASPNYEDHLEFFSIKVADGALTSQLQNINVGDQVLVNKKPTGTLLLDDVYEGKNLYLLSTGTGLAPFLSLIRDPQVYERFEKVILVHGVRHVSDLAYKTFIEETLHEHEYLGELIKKQLIYYPTVTRESFKNQGRITQLISNGELAKNLNLSQINPATDRAMVCGGPDMLNEISELLEEHEFTLSPRIGYQGGYVIERAFVEK